MTAPAKHNAGKRPRRVAVAVTLLATATVTAIAVGVLAMPAGTPKRAAGPRGLTPVGAVPTARPAAVPLPHGPGVLVAEVVRATTMRRAPGGPALGTLRTHTEFGSPQYMWVVRTVPGWLGVVSPLAGNGRLGWIPQSVTELGMVTWRLRVSLSARALEVVVGGRVIRRFTVAIGAPGSPTPTGTFAVTDRLTTGNPSGSYGCCILALSALAPHAIQGWDGGYRIAIHSTPQASTIGEAVSHGCLHVTMAESRWLMTHVPLATPTVISE